MKRLGLWLVMIAMSLCCGANKAEAAATVTVLQTSEGVYSVSIDNVVNAAAVDFVINYDSAALVNPLVTDGELIAEAAAHRELNNSTPGVLRVVYLALKGFKKPGKLATVVFSKKSSAPAAQARLESKVYSSDGSEVAAKPVVTVNKAADNVTPKFNSGSGAVRESGSEMWKASQAADVTNVLNRSVSVKQPDIQAADQKIALPPEEKKLQEPAMPEVQSQRTATEDGTRSSAPQARDAGLVAAEVEKKDEIAVGGLKKLESVLELFRTYKGARNLGGFSKLFADDRFKAAGVAQIPGIAVSDGKQRVSVTVSLPPGSGVPGFSLKGANLKGLKSFADKPLELDILPQKGKLDVRVSISLNKDLAEIPLLVVPAISGNILALSDQELEKLILKADSKNKTLLYDLNADGKQDYQDDYILVAHWLMKQQSEKKSPAAERLPADSGKKR